MIRKYQKLIFAFLMALIMSCIMSLLISVFNVGLSQNIVHIWLKAWSFAFVVAFPTVSVVAPLVHAFINRMMVFESLSRQRQRR